MAKGAATEARLGALHDKVADVFLKVLARYEQRLDVLENVNADDISSEVLDELLDDGKLPNPAMLSAITKFLKDNDIGIDSEKVNELSGVERRLAERRKTRGNVVELTTLEVGVG